MLNLKEEALNVIKNFPETVNIDDIMYDLYVFDKLNKGREAVDRGDVITIEKLKEEIKSW